MATSRGRSALATIVGWILAILVVWFLFGWLIGTLRVIIRFALILFLIGAVAVLWLKLRGDD